MLPLNTPAIKIYPDSYAGQESIKGEQGSKASWFHAMEISVNMVFHFLLIHCYSLKLNYATPTFPFG